MGLTQFFDKSAYVFFCFWYMQERYYKIVKNLYSQFNSKTQNHVVLNTDQLWHNWKGLKIYNKHIADKNC